MRNYGSIFFVTICLSQFIFFVLSENILSSNIVYTWNCENNKCIKELIKDQSGEDITSFKVCKLLCGQSIIWPQPTSYSWNGPPIPIKTVSFEVSPADTVLTEKLQYLIEGAKDVFWERISSEKQNIPTLNEENAYILQVRLEITDLFHHSLTLLTDESYTLTIEKENNMMQALIKGETFFGVRHGLETLSQLIVYDNVRGTLIMPSKVNINDKPKYPYRGLMLDTSRNYISKESIKNTINIMAANKLNSFHWHITDSQSFPLMLYGLQQFSEYGAYSPDKIYTEEDVKEIVNYAFIRGIRVVPELDAPAHIGEGWQWAPSGTILCLAKEPWQSYCMEPPCGQLNPLSEYTYDILGELYMDYSRLFEPDVFHMGGDEVHFGCWNTSEEIKKWINDNYSVNENTGQNNSTDSHLNQNHKDTNTSTKGYFALWNLFQETALKKLKKANKDRNKQPEVVLWSSDLTTGENLNFLKNTDYIVQVWTRKNDHVFNELLDKNFRVIISNYDGLYLSSGFGSWVNDYDDSIYRAWHSVYDNIPPIIETLSEEKKKLILGQEVALWTETCSEGSLDARLWPRAAALAERTWSDPESYWRNAESRMLYHRDRLVQLGAKADAIEPEWCNINRGGCS